MSELNQDWNNEAYVSVHLVEPMLELAGLPRKSEHSHWYPQYKINAFNFNTEGIVKEVKKPVDFLIIDKIRNLKFLIEVKPANNKIDDRARFQLESYLQYSGLNLGILVDPFSVETYNYIKGKLNLINKHNIINVNQVQPVSSFIKEFLDLSIENAYHCNSYL